MRLYHRNVRWKVSLNDGTTYYEGKKPFKMIEGDKPAWVRLQEFVKKYKLRITSLALITNNRTWNLPSSGDNPKFRAFDLADKPISYNYKRILGLDYKIRGGRKIKQIFVIGEAIFKNYKIEVWVDEDRPDNSWIVTNENIHT